MKKLIVFLGVLFFYSCTYIKDDKSVSNDLVLVKGGFFVNQNSNLYKRDVRVNDFYISRTEITQKEWVRVMGTNPSRYKGDDLPVEMVSWYDCIAYCIQRSKQEGLQPYYKILKDSIDEFNKSEYDTVKCVISIYPLSNGYRLPKEIEWEYAAGGGQLSKSYTYSGGNDMNTIAWYWRNCGDQFLTENWNYQILENNHGRTRPVASKTPNELGLFDMTGNVREWCEDWFENQEIPSGHFRSHRGGGWIGVEMFMKNNDRDYFEANGIGPDQGFRVCRNVGE
ncbi:formylglycine-generating enzyme family protein [Aquimarina spongiae]|uniref:Formylglycine-generating enzyme, required for sulfatase activity, contains SUMF1/FGE domain n=1 Tax=Aquimarina spongiae TaxID=570521 RepID=A0A1M6I775_9FLAO|nr:SUMF1/EgtB/PvdO family nonheme iron enzyme [Aquimarina spongiae]SHJ30300.1 Formylglycine-generating enzyme, required for sulfatase activity, contains SUMF1/FGE domain [Aquimarina spongiae]